MKQNIYMVALLAGMLALAGCGGGNSSTPANATVVEGAAPSSTQTDSDEDQTTKTYTQEELDNEINTQSENARKASCTGDGLAYDESSMLCKVDTSKADAQKAAADARTLHRLIGNSSVTLGATPEFFTSAKDADKGHAMITVDGAVLDANEKTIDNPRKLAQAKSTEFGGRDAKEHPRSQKSDGTLEDLKVSGTYFGIPGMFTCSGDSICTSQNGQPKTVTNTTWTFEPTDPEAKRKVDIKWGWWVTRSTNAGNPVTMVNFFRNNHNQTPLALTNAHLDSTATATYTGDTVGLYSVPNDSGGFTATATLTATFAASGITRAKLEGTISSFKGADGEDRNWSVQLKEITGDASGAYSPTAAGTSIWTLDGVEGDATGEAWRANSYGGSGSKAPTVIMGDFSAEHQGAEMIGVFGTQIQP